MRAATDREDAPFWIMNLNGDESHTVRGEAALAQPLATLTVPALRANFGQ